MLWVVLVFLYKVIATYMMQIRCLKKKKGFGVIEGLKSRDRVLVSG